MLSSTFLDEAGKPSFNTLQNYGSSQGPILFYVFDLMMLRGRDLKSETLSSRRDLLERSVLPKLTDPIRAVPRFDSALADMVKAVRAQGLEGLWQSGWIAPTNRASVPGPGEKCGSTRVRNL
jgi:ATP-dependent DNA ligase